MYYNAENLVKHKELEDSIVDDLEVTGKVVLTIDLVTSEFNLVNYFGMVVNGI
jgi:hypothetical protein